MRLAATGPRKGSPTLNNLTYNLMETAAVISKGLHRLPHIREGRPRLSDLKQHLDKEAQPARAG
jgi:hypothetical protein